MGQKGAVGSPFTIALGVLAASALLGLVAIVLARGFYPQLSAFFGVAPAAPRAPRKDGAVNGPTVAQGRPPATPVKPPEAAAPREFSWSGLEFKQYSGKYTGLYGAKKLLAESEQNMIDSVKELKDGSGLFPSAKNRITFVFKDISECDFDGPYCITTGSPEADGSCSTSLVEIPIEQQVLEWYPARKLLSSALVEAILSQEAPGYRAAPAWLRHGLALYFSGLGPSVERRVLLLADSPPLSKIRPLDDCGGDSWVVGHWAISALAGKKGQEGVKSLVDNLRFSTDIARALQSIGETQEGFQAIYRSWARGYLGEMGANREAYLDMVGLLRREEEAAALKELEAILREHPVDLYAGECRYYRGYTLYRLGKYDESIRAFTDLLVNYPHTTSKQGKAHFFMGRCYYILNYKPLAEEQYRLAALDPSSRLLEKMAGETLKEFE